MRSLVINRHSLTWTVGERGRHLPNAPAERYLITRTFAGGSTGLRPASFPHTAVIDMSDADRLVATARWMIGTGRVEHVVAIHEKDMLLAAQLREEHGLGGATVSETLNFRDKCRMKGALEAAGYTRLPRYRAVDPDALTADWPWSGPTVVKSRWGVGASEVRIADSAAAVRLAVAELSARGHELEIEEYVPGRMYHCDSVVVDGEVLFTAVCEYIANPGAFATGGVAGSVIVPDGPLRTALLGENTTVLRMLGLTSGVTHVEFFHTPDGELVFCEAAARPGGGGIDVIVEELYGVDLIRAAIEIQHGVRPTLTARAAAPGAVTGIVGMYHCEHGDTPAADIVRDLPGVLHYAFAAQEVATGVVRHCTDYAHKTYLTAESREQFDERAREVVAAVRATQDLADREAG